MDVTGDPHATAREALHTLADRIPATVNAERDYDLTEQALDALAADLASVRAQLDTSERKAELYDVAAEAFDTGDYDVMENALRALVAPVPAEKETR